MMSDGSISGYTCTHTEKGNIELVSPILNGESDLRMVNRFLTAINKSGATVDRTCGTHISVGLNGKMRWERMSLTNKVAVANRIVDFYGHFMNVFDAISPNCRNHAENGYIGGVGRLYNDGSTSMSRYSAINLKQYITYGRIEFRQPGMTLDKKKIGMWLKVINAMVSMALNENHVSRTMDLDTMPKTLTGFVQYLGIGISLQTTLFDRISHMADTYSGQRTMRREVLFGGPSSELV